MNLSRNLGDKILPNKKKRNNKRNNNLLANLNKQKKFFKTIKLLILRW